MATINEVRNELIHTDHFPRLRDHVHLRDDCARIGSYLSGGWARVRRELVALERAMQRRVHRFGGLMPKRRQAREYFADWQARSRLYYDEGELKRRGAGDVAPKNQRYTKVLTGVLDDSERAHGFVTTEMPRVVWALTPEQFNQMLTSMRHWKDVGVIPRHGEFTHRIQWYLICRAGLPLHFPPAQIFRRIPNFDHIAIEWASGGAALWDAVVDRGAPEANAPYFKVQSAQDFRSPEMLNDFLCSAAVRNELPLLNAFLVARRAKRDTIDIHQHVAMKMFGKTMSELTQVERNAKYQVASSEGTGILR